MEGYSILFVKFRSSEDGATFCDLVNAYKDRVWQETSERLEQKRMSDVSQFEAPAGEVFISFLERLQSALSNPGIERKDFRLFQNCTVSRKGSEVQLVVEGVGDVEQISGELAILLRSSNEKVVESVEYEARS